MCSILPPLPPPTPQDSAAVGDAEQTERRLRSVGAGIVTWGVLGSALENIRGEVREMSEVNDRALTAVEQTQTEARQQVSGGQAAGQWGSGSRSVGARRQVSGGQAAGQ